MELGVGGGGGNYLRMKIFIIIWYKMFFMGCKGIKSELNSTLFDCYVRNQIKSRLIMA